jgi:3-dehydroquinate synthase
MPTVKVDLSQSSTVKSYSVHIGSGILTSFFSFCPREDYSSILFAVDENLKNCTWVHGLIKIIKEKLDRDPHVLVLPAGENSKNIKTVSAVWDEFQNASADRKSLLVSVGGGAISDLCGFAASTYMRGMDFIHVPTTLLAQVDASIGGKTGINFNEIKNLIGTFNQPAAVIIDIQTLSTLPDREFYAGFAEIIKHGLIQDEKYYNKVKNCSASCREDAILEDLIYGSCQIKASVVEKDEAEGGLRKILNFGHTFGHAIEVLSHNTERPLLHGEAISLGMVAEAKLSEFLGFITHKQVIDIEETLKNYNLPIRLDFDVSYEDIIKKISSDKKNSGTKVNWSLLKKIGKANYDQTASHEQVKEALQYISHVQ